MVKNVMKMVKKLERKDEEIGFKEVCDMFERVEGVMMDRAVLFRKLEEKGVAKRYMMVEKVVGGMMYVEKCVVCRPAEA